MKCYEICKPNNNNYMRHCRPSFSDSVPRMPFNKKTVHTCTIVGRDDDNDRVEKQSSDGENDDLWLKMKEEAKSDVEHEPVLSTYYFTSILSHNSLESALANHLSIKLSNLSLSSSTLFDLFIGKASGDRHPKIGDGVLIGEGAKIGAGSEVLKDVPPKTTMVGNPVRLIGRKENPIRHDKIPSLKCYAKASLA
ncbi:hypothetical protein Dsin_023377 [Dipteronia sinensis]|uniref:Serine acetyltransferase N-terminal domain-containing protein n=1 Tax=Dipteronia sinensis TaxID=43782 RepID=A0AAE0E213_9ROSI|nr:hypothetical protein Dsin_023377 [Dipteronia sinensis]